MKDELEEYFRLPVEDFETCDPIQWWAGHRSQFPSLLHLAHDILAIPGMFWFEAIMYEFTNALHHGRLSSCCRTHF